MPGNETAIARFWASLALAPACALVLDFDGTLAPFNIERDAVEPYPGVLARLERLHGAGTRLHIVSGRKLADLLKLLPLAQQLHCWGSHGLEEWLPGRGARICPPTAAQLARLADAQSACMELGFGGQLEQKPGALALHWRGLPHTAVDRIAAELIPAWQALTLEDLLLCKFDGGVELRSAAANKGQVLRVVRSSLPPDGRLAYLGDDLTDEDAFGVVENEDLAVLVRSAPRPTLAPVWLQPPLGLLDFFDRWLAVTTATRHLGGQA
jgi:trehalose-phosphatase